MQSDYIRCKLHDHICALNCTLESVKFKIKFRKSSFPIHAGHLFYIGNKTQTFFLSLFIFLCLTSDIDCAFEICFVTNYGFLFSLAALCYVSYKTETFIKVGLIAFNHEKMSDKKTV